MSLRDYLALDEVQFRVMFRNSPIKRIKRRGFLRNVCVALGNMGDRDDLPALLNRPARIRDNFRRAVQTLSEQPQNLLSRANILPPVFPGSTNVGGG